MRQFGRFFTGAAVAAAILQTFVAGADAPVKPSRLIAESQAHIRSVPEFHFAARLAERLGIRLWIAGGTAAGWLNACRRRISGENLPTSFGELYRSTQDADILVDGSVDDAIYIEKMLCRRFPYRRGSQCIWEVRPLRFPRGKKPAVLGDGESSQQHTDTASLGAAEVTETPPGEPPIRDVRHWDRARTPFLTDVAARRIQFLPAEGHQSTDRFARGDNPEIFSVIRYCTKRFQYDLTPHPDDEAKLRAFVDAFDPFTDIATNYARTWLQHNGLKLLLNANDLEGAIAFLDHIGLRKKLFLAAGGFAATNVREGLAYTLTREALPSFTVGTGDGVTAEQLHLSTVFHNTRDFTTFEAITSSSLEVPNVFQSRPVPGETTHYGLGFYVDLDRTSPRDTGYRIEMRLRPDAREGSDFVRLGSRLLIRNRAALAVVRPKFASDPDRWIAYLEEVPNDSKDRGWRERFERTLRGWLADRHRWSDEDREKLESLLHRQLDLAEPSATLLAFGARALPPEPLKKLAPRWVYHRAAARLFYEMGADSRVFVRVGQLLSDDPDARRRFEEIQRLMDARTRRISATAAKKIVQIAFHVRSSMRTVDDLLFLLGERGIPREVLDGISPIAESLAASDGDARVLLALVDRGDSSELWKRLLRKTTTMKSFLERLHCARLSQGRLPRDFNRILKGVLLHLDQLSPTVAQLRELRALCPDEHSWTNVLAASPERIRSVVDAVELSVFAAPDETTRYPRLTALIANVSKSKLRTWGKELDGGAVVDPTAEAMIRTAVAALPPQVTGCRNLLLEVARKALAIPPEPRSIGTSDDPPPVR